MNKRHWPGFYPFIIAAYPSLSLLAVNIGQVDWQVVFRPLLLSLGLTLCILLLLRMSLGSSSRVGLLTSLFLALFFSYGHVYGLIESSSVLGVVVGRHRYILPLWLALGFFVGFITIRQKPGQNITNALYLSTLVLIAFPILSLISFGIKARFPSTDTALQPDAANSLLDVDAKAHPTIYSNILDEYPRQDVLLSTYDYDNSDFIQRLDELGFYIADKSMSNYSHTDASLASSLNLDYLQTLIGDLDPSSENRETLWVLIQNSSVRSYLEGKGYSIAAFETGYAWDQWEDADSYSGPAQSYLTRASLVKV